MMLRPMHVFILQVWYCCGCGLSCCIYVLVSCAPVLCLLHILCLCLIALSLFVSICCLYRHFIFCTCLQQLFMSEAALRLQASGT